MQLGQTHAGAPSRGIDEGRGFSRAASPGVNNWTWNHQRQQIDSLIVAGGGYQVTSACAWLKMVHSRIRQPRSRAALAIEHPTPRRRALPAGRR
jgi:hypothetical protein